MKNDMNCLVNTILAVYIIAYSLPPCVVMSDVSDKWSEVYGRLNTRYLRRSDVQGGPHGNHGCQPRGRTA